MPATHILRQLTKGNDGRDRLPPIELKRFHGVLDIEVDSASVIPPKEMALRVTVKSLIW